MNLRTRQSWRVAILLALSLALISGGREAAAQGDAQLQILNIGINLGWVHGIVDTQGVPVNAPASIGPNLGLINDHILTLIPMIPDPPYETTVEQLQLAAEILNNLAGRIGGMPRRDALHELDRLRNILRQALAVYQSRRPGANPRLGVKTGPNCDSALFDFGFFFGQGHTATQLGNTGLADRARSNGMQAARVGREAAANMLCTFPYDALVGLPFLTSRTSASFATSLVPMQTAVLGRPLPPGTPPPVNPPIPARPSDGTRVVPFAGATFTMTPNAGIPGQNRETHRAASAEQCLRLCLERAWCKSVDYERDAGVCFVQPVGKDDQPLRTTYPGNPYDNYTVTRSGSPGATGGVLGFVKTPNAGIPGFNQETHRNVSIRECKQICLERSWCKSVDYERANGTCFVQPVGKDDQKLRTTYPGDPYDNYTVTGRDGGL